MKKLRFITTLALLISFVSSFAFAGAHEFLHCKDAKQAISSTIADAHARDDAKSSVEVHSQKGKSAKEKSDHSNHLNCNHSTCCAVAMVGESTVTPVVDQSNHIQIDSFTHSNDLVESLYRPPSA